MKQQWWKQPFGEWRTLSREQQSHARNAFEFVEYCDQQRELRATLGSWTEFLLTRGTPPEPEWQSAPPDSPGIWQQSDALSPSSDRAIEWAVYRHQGELWMKLHDGANACTRVPKSDGYVYRKVRGQTNEQ